MDDINVTVGPTRPINQPAPIEKHKKKNRPRGLKIMKSKKILITLLALLLVALSGFLYYKYTEARKEVDRLSNPQEAAKTEAARLRDEVGQAYQVPDEVPTIATVVDASKLKSQAFFANAENGDRVLIFTQAKKAILYRPDTKKIIEVAPINIGNGADQPTPTE